MLPPSGPVETPPRSASAATMPPAKSTGSSLNDGPGDPPAGSKNVAAASLAGPVTNRDPRVTLDIQVRPIVNVRSGMPIWKCRVTHLEGVARAALLESPVALERQLVGVDEGHAALKQVRQVVSQTYLLSLLQIESHGSRTRRRNKVTPILAPGNGGLARLVDGAHGHASGLSGEVWQVEVRVLIQHFAGAQVADLQPAIAPSAAKPQPPAGVVAAETGKGMSVRREAVLRAASVVRKIVNVRRLSGRNLQSSKRRPR